MEDGGLAFPNWSLQGDWQPGMTLRDWFAGQALAGLLACPNNSRIEGIGSTKDSVSRVAYGLADAMLSQRNKEPV